VIKTGTVSQRIIKKAECFVIMKYFDFWPCAVLSFFPLELSSKILYLFFRYDNLKLHGLKKNFLS